MSKLIWKFFYNQLSYHEKISENNNHRFRRFKEQLLAET